MDNIEKLGSYGVRQNTNTRTEPRKEESVFIFYDPENSEETKKKNENPLFVFVFLRRSAISFVIFRDGNAARGKENTYERAFEYRDDHRPADHRPGTSRRSRNRRARSGRDSRRGDSLIGNLRSRRPIFGVFDAHTRRELYRFVPKFDTSRVGH